MKNIPPLATWGLARPPTPAPTPMAPARPSELEKWLSKHTECARDGAIKETRVHVYDWWRCTCGDVFRDPPRSA
jgi:hypothetical protein